MGHRAVGDRSGPGNEDVSAVVFMAVAVLGMSFMPLFVSLAGGSQNPFLVSAGLRIGLSVGYAGFLAVGYRDLLRVPGLWKLVAGRLVSWSMLLGTVSLPGPGGVCAGDPLHRCGGCFGPV